MTSGSLSRLNTRNALAASASKSGHSGRRNRPSRILSSQSGKSCRNQSYYASVDLIKFQFSRPLAGRLADILSGMLLQFFLASLRLILWLRLDPMGPDLSHVTAQQRSRRICRAPF
jgi:hypothetical protein